MVKMNGAVMGWAVYPDAVVWQPGTLASAADASLSSASQLGAHQTYRRVAVGLGTGSPF
jgi:hypothetical protein